MRLVRSSSTLRETRLSQRARIRPAKCGALILERRFRRWMDTKTKSSPARSITRETPLSLAQRITLAAFGGTRLWCRRGSHSSSENANELCDVPLDVCFS